MCLCSDGDCPDDAGELLLAMPLQGSPDPVALPALRKRGQREQGRCSAGRMGLAQRLAEERDNCVCIDIQKNVSLWYGFEDLLKNLTKLLCVKWYCSPLLLYSCFSKMASSSKELAVIDRLARLLHGGTKESCIHHGSDQCFLFKVKVGNEITTGTGPNKKVAKRNAAEAMLLQLGYKASTLLQDQPEKVRTNCYDAHILCLSGFLSGAI